MEPVENATTRGARSLSFPICDSSQDLPTILSVDGAQDLQPYSSSGRNGGKKYFDESEADESELGAHIHTDEAKV